MKSVGGYKAIEVPEGYAVLLSYTYGCIAAHPDKPPLKLKNIEGEWIWEELKYG